VAGDNTTTRPYGTLATAFNGSLRAAREALEEHAALLPEGRLGNFDTLLAEFARRRVRIAIYGEVKAGKSTLLNALAGAELSPAAFDPLTSVPVRVTYGLETKWRADGRTFETVDDLARLMRSGVVDAREVVVQTNLDLLQLGGQVDLEDTPGVGAEARFDSISASELAALDAVIVVVRYPALFTRFSRELVRRLEGDIGKLFVVWNLDTACADLDDEERHHHAENLRANVAGAHELYLVDARAAYQAGQLDDAGGIETSGLSAFRDGLCRFVSSDTRDVTALREAAKRAHLWLEAADRALAEREARLEAEIATAQRRLEATQRAADEETAAARDRFVSFQETLGLIGKQHGARAAAVAARLRKEIRAGRRQWIRTGEIGELENRVNDGLLTYANGIDAACAETVAALHEASRETDATVPVAPRDQTPLEAEALAPAERSELAVAGRGQIIRRAFWRRWYLPGLVQLERRGIKADLSKEGAWFEATAQAAGNAARAVLDAKLADIARRAAAEAERIREETRLTANETEIAQIKANHPVVATQCAEIGKINREARLLMPT
jgi:hypothetical protein